MRWEQTPNSSGNGSKTRRSSCNSSWLPKESGAQGQEEIQEGAALVEEQAPAPGRERARAQEAVRKVPALAWEREAAPEAGSVLVPVLVRVPDPARVEAPWERAGPESQAHRAPRLEVVMLRSGMA